MTDDEFITPGLDLNLRLKTQGQLLARLPVFSHLNQIPPNGKFIRASQSEACTPFRYSKTDREFHRFRNFHLKVDCEVDGVIGGLSDLDTYAVELGLKF